MNREIRKYFKKVKQNEITIKEAADELECSEKRFREEYEKYYDPFSENKRKRIFNFLSVLALPISIMSTVISLMALQVDRRSYNIEAQPDLNIKERLVTLYWDAEGQLTNTSDSIIEDQLYDTAGYITVPGLLVDNLGKTAAKDITYDWQYENNLDNFKEKFENISLPMDVVIDGDRVSVTGLEQNCRHEYPVEYDESSSLDIEGEEYVSIPSVYLHLMAKYCHEIFPENDDIDYSRFFSGEDLPQLELTMQYRNISDEINEDTVYIQFDPIKYNTLNGESGGCSFQIRTKSR